MVSIHLSLTILSKSLCPQDTATHSLQFQPSNSFSYYIIFFLEKLLLTQLQNSCYVCTGKASWATYHLPKNIYFHTNTASNPRIKSSVCHFCVDFCHFLFKIGQFDEKIDFNPKKFKKYQCPKIVSKQLFGHY